MVSAPSGWNLTLDANTGLLYGKLYNPSNTITYNFTVAANSINGTTNRAFSIIVIPDPGMVTIKWTTSSNLGTYDEGQYIELPLFATATDGSLVFYAVSGGMLPPHLLVDNVGGTLKGYIEYGVLTKTYYFEITAYNTTYSSTQQFSITINKKYHDQFLTVSIPVTGLLKNSITNDVANLQIRSPSTPNILSMTSIYVAPELEIIKGIVVNYDNPDDIVNQPINWLHQLDLNIGSAANTTVTSGNVAILYRNVVDHQANSSTTTHSSAVFNTNVQTGGTVYPQSIYNIRKTLLNGRTYVTSGGGSGGYLTPNLNWNDGSITNITVSNTGNGYTSIPNVIVIGNGNGASITTTLGVVGYTITNKGNGWISGDTVNLYGMVAQNSANIIVGNVTVNGGINDIKIIYPGNYTQVSDDYDVQIVNASTGASARIKPSWGISSANVINGGSNYNSNTFVNITGSEILPWWKKTYFPTIDVGTIPIYIADLAANQLNIEKNQWYGTTLHNQFAGNSFYGVNWNPNYIVLTWEGIRWLGQTTFDIECTTFDGNSLRFEESADAYNTLFDKGSLTFDDHTWFDWKDPLQYNFFDAWGGTVFDSGSTPYDFYKTVFDELIARKNSTTKVGKWISMPQKIYSGNNAVL
jgi:hypothetical protein